MPPHSLVAMLMHHSAASRYHALPHILAESNACLDRHEQVAPYDGIHPVRYPAVQLMVCQATAAVKAPVLTALHADATLGPFSRMSRQAAWHAHQPGSVLCIGRCGCGCRRGESGHRQHLRMVLVLGAQRSRPSEASAHQCGLLPEPDLHGETVGSTYWGEEARIGLRILHKGIICC